MASVLGAGGFGKVYRATDVVTHDDVAVKVLHSLSEDQLTSFQSEISLLRFLRLPGVVAVRDDGLDGGIPYLVTDMVDGMPFPGLPVPCDWEDIEERIVALLETLARVHAAGVAHRDLKPANVLVTDAGAPVVLDFGIARAARGSRAHAEGLMGTPAYLAPEQALGQWGNARSDLYALGAMVYEALTGRLTHPASSIRELLQAKLSSRPVPLAEHAPDVPPHVAIVIDRMLETSPDARPATAAAVLQQLGVRTPLNAVPRLAVADDPIERCLEHLGARRSVAVVGPSGFGASRLLLDLAERLGASDAPVECVRTKAARAPFASLPRAWRPTPARGAAAPAGAAAPERLNAALDAGAAVVLADDVATLDAATRDWLHARLASSGVVVPLRAESDAPAGCAVVALRAWTEEELRGFFHGPDVIFHFREDGARVLHERTSGVPGEAARVLSAWVRAGLCHWEDDKIRIERPSLDRLCAGLVVAPRGDAAEKASALDADTQRVLAIAQVAGGSADAKMLAQATSLALSDVQRRLEAAEQAGVVENKGDELAILDTVGFGDTWSTGEALRVHGAFADHLDAGDPVRLQAALRTGDVLTVMDEALAVAHAAEDEGRIDRAFAALQEAFALVSRSAAVPEDKSIFLARELVRIVLASNEPRLVEITRFWMDGFPSQAPVVRGMRELLLAAQQATQAQTGGQGLAFVESIAEFEDVELEAARWAVRVRISASLGLEEFASAAEASYAWAVSTGVAPAIARTSDWLGVVSYRRARFRDAEKLHAIAQAGAPTALGRFYAAYNRYMALAEYGDGPSMSEAAASLRSIASTTRHSFAESCALVASWDCRYRACEALEVDGEVLAAVEVLGATPTASDLLRQQLVVAFRTRDPRFAGLLRQAHESALITGHNSALLLTECFRLATHGSPDAAEVREFAASLPHTRAGAQLHRVLEIFAGVPPDENHAKTLANIGDYYSPSLDLIRIAEFPHPIHHERHI